MAAEGSNFRSTGDKLYSYYTLMAQRTANGIIVNACKYSVTTSKHQGYIRAALDKYGLKYTEVDGYICRGTSDLTRHLKKEA